MSTVNIVGVTTSFTSDPIAASLATAGWDIRTADFNQIHGSLLDPRGEFGDDLTHLVVLWRLEDIFSASLAAWRAGDPAARSDLIDGIDQLIDLVIAAQTRTGIAVVLGTPPQPVGLGIDALDPVWSLALDGVVAHARAAIDRAATSHAAIRVIDQGMLVNHFGIERAHDTRNQALYRQPYASAFNRLLGAEVVRCVRSFSEPPPKAIVLDADNTLWGGVVGEDGVAGVAIGGTFPGVAFEHFQHALQALKAQGILLAVCSKNDPGAVEEVFDRRSEMVLRRDDIAAWRVNWDRKSDNIRSIAAEFNIGLDSVVFVDDSDFELAEVAAQLPDVRRVQVPEELEELPLVLAETGWFRSMTVSQEDRDRTTMIQTESERRSAAETLTHEEFLASLDLQVTLHRDDPLTLQRVTQLVNKTNQFNLTTIRRNENEVEALLRSDRHTVYAAVVDDRFGSYGLVGVVVAEWSDDAAAIDTLLMSCRVLKRGIETALLAAVARDAEARGVTKLVGRFEATPKNSQVARLYPEHGFTIVGQGHFELDDLAALAKPDHITCVDA